jgi:drug/metabolite transporter (DMT)-like permease
MSPLVPILLSVGLVVVAQVLFKVGAGSMAPLSGSEQRDPIRLGLRALRIPGVMLGFVLYGAAAAAWLYVLATTPLSYAYPFLGLTYFGVTLVSVAVLKERLSTLQWVGLAVICLGALAVALSM